MGYSAHINTRIRAVIHTIHRAYYYDYLISLSITVVMITHFAHEKKQSEHDPLECCQAHREMREPMKVEIDSAALADAVALSLIHI